MQWLDGKKTFAIVAAVLVLIAIMQFGHLSPEAKTSIMNAVNAGLALGLAALRDGINKATNNNPLVKMVVDPAVKQAEENLKKKLDEFWAQQSQLTKTLPVQVVPAPNPPVVQV